MMESKGFGVVFKDLLTPLVPWRLPVLGYQGRRVTAGAAQPPPLTGLELCSPECRDTKSLPGAARVSRSPLCCCSKPPHFRK